VYYNPAGLAEIGSAKVALSGTVFASISQHYDAWIVTENTNVPLDVSGFNTIPTAFVGTAKLGDWVGAFSILVPYSIQFGDHATLSVPNVTTNMVYSTTETEQWYGLSIARKLSDKVGFGLSVFGVQHAETSLSGFDLGNVANNAGIFGTNLTRTDLSSYGLLATFGVSYVASSRVRFGLRAQSAMAQIYGKGESFSISRTVLGSATPTVSGENVAGAANYGIPFDIGLGTALKPVDWLTFLADVSLQLPMSYQQFPASLNDQVVSLGATPRVNLGVEAFPRPAFPLRFGFYCDPSATTRHPGDPGYWKNDYYGLTAGIGFNSEHVRTSVGGFYVWSSGQMTPSGTTTSAATSVTAIGAMLTTAYVF
jgi:hypothetical protein